MVIDGNASDYLGVTYRGDWRGIKGGKIVVTVMSGATSAI